MTGPQSMPSAASPRAADGSSPLASVTPVAGVRVQAPVPVGAGAPAGGNRDQTCWRIDLPLLRPLSLNAREHWRVKAKHVARVRGCTELEVRAAGVPQLARIAVELHYVPRDRRRRDPLNLVATLKPIEDGIVDAGVVPDDTPEFVEPTMPRVDPADPKATVRLYVVIHDLGVAA